MLQAKYSLMDLVTLISQLAQGVFRAGQWFLIALGLIALTQILPVPQQSGRAIDAMGGSAEGLAPAYEQDERHAAMRWFATVQARVADALELLKAAQSPVSVGEESATDAGDSSPALSPALARLTAYLSTRYRVSEQVLANLVVTAHEVGNELGIDPLLIVSVMAVESGFNPLSESRVGAQGLMQVIPKYHGDKIDSKAGDLALFTPETNIRVGALVLRDYIRRAAGSVETALQIYAGASNDPEAGYARKVLGTRDRLRQAMRG